MVKLKISVLEHTILKEQCIGTKFLIIIMFQSVFYLRKSLSDNVCYVNPLHLENGHLCYLF